MESAPRQRPTSHRVVLALCCALLLPSVMAAQSTDVSFRSYYTSLPERTDVELQAFGNTDDELQITMRDLTSGEAVQSKKKIWIIPRDT